MAHKESVGKIKRVVFLGHTGFVGSRLIGCFREEWPSLEVIGFSSKEMDLTDADAASNLKDYFDMDTAVIMSANIKSNYGNDLETYSKNVHMVENVSRIL